MAFGGRPFTCAEYHVAWICPVADVGLVPARLMLDEEHPAPEYNTEYDENTYRFGLINGHTIVIAACPRGETSNINAGRLTGSMFKTFPNIRMAVLVGIGGGIPRAEVSKDSHKNIHLGDVVVGWPGDDKPACVYYDRGRSKINGQFEMLGTMKNPDWRLIRALSFLVSDHELNKTTFIDQLARLRHHKKNNEFTHPGLENDKLFNAMYHHVSASRSDCIACDQSELVQRPRRTEEDQQTVVFHQGRIATGNSVIQDGEQRDRIRAKCDGALCVETEAAGVNVNRECLVICGISDYADSHKSDAWRDYAAGNAAAFTRELLCKVPSDAVKTAQEISPAPSLQVGEMLDGPSAPRQQTTHLLPGPAARRIAFEQPADSPGTQTKNYDYHPMKRSTEAFQKMIFTKGFIANKEAKHFISKLACTLKSIITQQKDLTSVLSEGKAEVVFGHRDVSPQEMKRLRAIIKSSSGVCFNTGSQRFKVTKNGRIVQERSMNDLGIHGYKVKIMQTKRTSLPARHVRSRVALRQSTETIAKICITHSSGEQAAVVAHIRYQEGPEGLNSLHPSISIGKTLPRGSLVFTVVKEGDVEALKCLLEDRQCTLWDRDTFGTPLLHYALLQPRMCRFLIENGADIDEFASSAWNPKYECPPLSSQLNDSEMDETEFQNTLACRRLLLHAGADPTIPCKDGFTHLDDLLAEGTFDSLKVSLDLGMSFICLDQRDKMGDTVWTTLFQCFKMTDLAAAVNLLIDRGADMHARDRFGRNCLHMAIMHVRLYAIKEYLDSVMLLIQRGADIFATDQSGRSIFEDAYECEHFRYRVGPGGSCRGDLWDAALVQCGLGEHVWPPEERISHFTRRYTKCHFAKLWEGSEHLCPYPAESSSPCSFIIHYEDSKGHDDDDDSDYSEDSDHSDHSDHSDFDDDFDDDDEGDEDDEDDDDCDSEDGAIEEICEVDRNDGTCVRDIQEL